MRSRISASLSKFPILAGISISTLMVLGLYFIVQQRVQIFKGIEKRELKIAAAEVKSRMVAVFRQASVANSRLSFLVRKYGILNDFEEIAKELLVDNVALDAIELQKNGSAPMIYPETGRECLTGKGCIAIIERSPISINEQIWGHSTILIRVSTLIKYAGLDSGQQNYIYQISRINPGDGKEQYFLSSPLPSKKNYPVTLDIPEGKWRIHISFAKQSPVLSRPPIVIFGLLLSIIAGFLTYFLVRRPVELKRQVDEKTRDLIEKDKQFNRALNEAQENERLQISMELHDHIKQILAASMITLDHVRMNSDKQAVVDEAIDRVRRYLREANEDIRKISHRLAPSVDSMDLEEKIRLLAGTMNMNDNVKFEFKMFTGTESISNTIQLALYRILQEQLTNIIKYSEATFVAINMETQDNELVMSVRDNGKGFDLHQKKSGIGLENMRRRANTLNGDMEIISSPGNGCELVVRLPLN